VEETIQFGKMIMQEIIQKAKNFIYRNARPLDFARWQYHFENGRAEDVVNVLSHYQNEDGGFGYALEPDFWNPNSSPIATWAATEYLRKIGFQDADHPMIEGILQYLESGADYDVKHQEWRNTVPTNNDFPHAIWWTYGKEDGGYRYNPTACLAGFIIKFADPSSKLYEKGAELVKQAVSFFEANVPFREEHITSCFIGLYEYCTDAGAGFFDRQAFENLLIKQVNANLCRESEKWFSEYTPRPSRFITSKASPFLAGNEELVKLECKLIRENWQPDGGFPVTWKWRTDYQEFEVAANWWRSSLLIENMLFLKAFDSI